MKKIALILLILTMGIWCMENREKVGLSYDRAAKSVKRFLWGTKAAPQEVVIDDEQTLPEPEPEEPVIDVSAPVLVLTRLNAMLTAPELAPDTYVTKERISMMSDEGIKAIPAGVEVQKTGEQDGKFIVKDEKVEIMVEPHRLTRDPGEIAVLKQEIMTSNVEKNSKGATPTSKKAPKLISSERAQIEGTIMGLDRRISELRTFLDQKMQADYEARKRGRINRHAADLAPLHAQINDLVKQRTYYANLLRKSR